MKAHKNAHTKSFTLHEARGTKPISTGPSENSQRRKMLHVRRLKYLTGRMCRCTARTSRIAPRADRAQQPARHPSRVRRRKAS
eukprot:512201-Rhodomonas_salina.4